MDYQGFMYMYSAFTRSPEEDPSLAIPCTYEGKFAEVKIDDDTGEVCLQSIIGLPDKLSSVIPTHEITESEYNQHYMRRAWRTWKERQERSILQEESDMFCDGLICRIDGYEITLWCGNERYFAFDAREPKKLKVCHSKRFAEFWVANIGYAVNREINSRQLYPSNWERFMPDEYHEAFMFFREDDTLWIALIHSDGYDSYPRIYSAERFYEKHPEIFSDIVGNPGVYMLPADSEMCKSAVAQVFCAYRDNVFEAYEVYP